MTALIQSIFDDFKRETAASFVYPATSKSADESFLRSFEKWDDLLGIHHAALNDDCGYDKAWIFNLFTRNAGRRAGNYPLPLTCILVNTRTGHLSIRERKLPASAYESLLETVLKNNVSTGIKNFDWDVITDVPFTGMHKRLQGRALQASFELVAYTTHAAVNLNINKRSRRKKLGEAAQSSAKTHLFAQIDAAMNDIASYLDPVALAASEALCTNLVARARPDAVSALSLYNHIVNAGADPRARESRISALPLIGKTGHLYHSNADVWKAIDRGESVFKALGSALGVRADTIRHMVKNSALFAHEPKTFAERARFLDAVPVARWPKDAHENVDFLIVCSMAESYGRAFDFPTSSVLQQWMKEAGPRCRWRHLAIIKLAKPIRALLADKASLINFMDGSIPHSKPHKKPEQNPHLRLSNLLKTDRFMSVATQRYTRAMADIDDMKRDLQTRIVSAAVLHTLPDGLQIDADMLHHMSVSASAQLWKYCPPSEQIEASDYWHSPRVNFRNRFNSVVNTLGMTWHTLFDTPMVVGDVTIVPLGSDDALRDEGNAMHHCVWSYGSSCLGSGHHIFSLRDKNGDRLSTLNLIENRHPDGRVSFYINQNLSIYNQPAPKNAEAAAQAFLKTLNEGKIAVDWAPIQAERDAFSAKKIDASVGYDFRDPIVAQEVFNLYAPCLPRKVLRASGGTLDGFARVLCIRDVIAAPILLASIPQPSRPAAP